MLDLLQRCLPAAAPLKQFDFAAALPLAETFQFVVDLYVSLQWFDPVGDELLFKFSSDNREIIN